MLVAAVAMRLLVELVSLGLHKDVVAAVLGAKARAMFRSSVWLMTTLRASCLSAKRN